MEDNLDFEIDEINPDGIAYADINLLVDVFSGTEYDSLEKAASEIIDNSIDANAKNIIIKFKTAHDSEKGRPVLSEIYFLDDGEGMTPGKLQHIIGFGKSTQSSQKAIGRFGIGLNQASLFACNCFSVYSWKSENEIYVETFDVDEIKASNIKKSPVPKKVSLPSTIDLESIALKTFKIHGTLVVWSKFKPNKIAKPTTISNRMHKEFGRVFRNFITDRKLRISTWIDTIDLISPIDPMFLLEDAEYLGAPDGTSTKVQEGEPLFEIFQNDLLDNGIKTYDVPYFDNYGTIKYSKLYLKASVIKEKFYYKAAYKDGYQQPGDTDIGAYVNEYMKGITVVRNGREIDFNYFGFYNSTNQPADRWFKMEIDFTGELDDAFHVSNNKQHVEMKKTTESKVSDYKESDPNYPIWLRLNGDITRLLAAMRKRNKLLVDKAKREKNILKENYVIDNNSSSTISNTEPIKEERLDDIIKSLKENNKSDLSDETIFFDNTQEKQLKSNATRMSPLNSLFENSSQKANDNILIKDINKMILEKNSIEIFYDEIDDEQKIEYHYDSTSSKYFISFNHNLFSDSQISKDIEMMIALLCVEIMNVSPTSSNYKALNKVLIKYLSVLSDIQEG